MDYFPYMLPFHGWPLRAPVLAWPELTKGSPGKSSELEIPCPRCVTLPVRARWGSRYTQGHARHRALPRRRPVRFRATMPYQDQVVRWTHALAFLHWIPTKY